MISLRWLVLALAALANQVAPATKRPAAPEPAPRAALEQEVFHAINQVRHKEGIPELVWDDRLAAEARRHSYNMVARWFFAHEDPIRGALAQRLRDGHIPWRTCAENIYNEQGFPDPAVKAVESWMHSPGHRANILDRRFTHTGVGVAARVDGTMFFTQEFLLP